MAVGNHHSSGTIGGGEALSSHWESILVAEAVTMCREMRKGLAESKSQGRLENGLNVKLVSAIHTNPLAGDRSLTGWLQVFKHNLCPIE